MTLAPFVHALGRGPSRSRNLDRPESADAMTAILSGQAAPEAVGALLMLMRYRGESAAEVAGFVDAMRLRTAAWREVGAQLDWPSYAAGRSRGLPWFLLAAKLVAQGGTPVFLHGWNSHQSAVAAVRPVLASLEIPLCSTPDAVCSAFDDKSIAYVPVEALDPEFLKLLKLRETLGLRSAINTCLRVLNPAGAPCAVQGVFHPPYRNLQQDAGQLLGQKAVSIIKGGGGEFERHPGKSVELFGLKDGVPVAVTVPASISDTRRLADEHPNPDHLTSLWAGSYQDPFAQAVVIGTAALALWSLGASGTLESAMADAQTLWEERV